MNFDEQTAKELLEARGIRIPRGRVVTTAEEAAAVASELATPVVIKPLLPTGRRGKAGLIRFAESPRAASAEAAELLAHAECLRVEERIPVERELYAGIVTDRSTKSPMMLFSPEGGVDVETAQHVTKRPIDIRRGVSASTLAAFPENVRAVLETLYVVYRTLDADLLEINPLAVTTAGELIALDAKLVVDDSALGRHPELPLPPADGTALEKKAREAGLYYIELDGDVGVLANGAGLTMATLDAVRFHGGRPANFMEIGGDAYRKAREALEIVLGNPRVRSLLVNLCGAYARTDVMIDGFLTGWQALAPSVPVVFSIHGTGEARAIELVKKTLGLEPFDEMDDAVKEAIGLV